MSPVEVSLICRGCSMKSCSVVWVEIGVGVGAWDGVRVVRG